MMAPSPRTAKKRKNATKEESEAAEAAGTWPDVLGEDKNVVAFFCELKVLTCGFLVTHSSQAHIACLLCYFFSSARGPHSFLVKFSFKLCNST